MSEHYVEYNGSAHEIVDIVYDLSEKPLYRLGGSGLLVHSDSSEVRLLRKEEPNVVY